jgi:hypothetical protein
MNSEAEADNKTAVDFVAALERLQAGTPTKRELQERLADGRLRINIATVALESGHSRSLIGYDGCAFPETRAKILRAVTGDPAVKKETLKQEIARLRNVNSELQDKLDIATTAQAELLIRFDLAKVGYHPDGRPIRRATKSDRLKAMNVVAPKGDDSKTKF